ncbi:MAG: rod shape-determining protein RodA [Nitrospirae bacterium]|nr:rod shape-determining protein RodA [Nitrospirota bacterium]
MNLFGRLRVADPLLLGLFVFLVLFGVLNIYSATQSYPPAGVPLYLKQLGWGVLSVAALVGLARVDPGILYGLAYVLYGLGVALILLTYAIGHEALGARRWLTVGGFFMQPSELMKLFIPLVVARYLHGLKAPMGFGLRELVVPLLLIAGPVLLIFRQPDLGTAAQIAIAAVSMILMTDVRRGLLIKAATAVLICAPGGWFLLRDYQRQRLISFLDPEKYELGAGYQVIQSKIAVGSGQLFGKGFGMGTQSRLQFLPQRHSDFIYSVVGEEWGFIGAVLVLGLVFLLFFRAVRRAYGTGNIFHSYLVVGLSLQFVWQSLLNMMMVVGLLPVVGIPLPLLSYGGTNLLVMGCLFGLMMAVRGSTAAPRMGAPVR